MYGVTFKYKTPLYAAMIGSAVGGILCAILNVGSYAGGPPGLFTFAMFLNPNPTVKSNDLLNMIIAIVAAAVVTFVMTMILYKDEKADEIDANN